MLSETPQDDHSASFVVRDTVPMTSSVEVTEMKMCRWACSHTLIDHAINDNIRERIEADNITEKHRKARQRWFGCRICVVRVVIHTGHVGLGCLGVLVAVLVVHIWRSDLRCTGCSYTLVM